MNDDRELLLEAATSAFRERDSFGRVLASPAWADLASADREELFDRQAAARQVEAAIDPDGLSATARAVLARVQHLGQIR
ncbi:MAG: hypothetical protein KBD01_14365 [Acidobacteria bacterium]|nr:hypothetical protein [Acidobacteriota bacterium]